MERPEIGSLWRHKKNGTEYMVLNFVMFQRDSADDEIAIVYTDRNLIGKAELRACSLSAFLDGRFEMISR